MRHEVAVVIAALAFVSGRPASAQNDWQFPDPYFGAFQHRNAGTPEAERRYRAEIAPQQPLRWHDLRQSRPASGPRHRPAKHRARTR